MDDQAEPLLEELDRCLEVNDALREENSHLREAAGTFGELAERLNTILREDRRDHLVGDRRAVARAEPDRRSVSEPVASR
jgi:hypothetical protein